MSSAQAVKNESEVVELVRSYLQRLDTGLRVEVVARWVYYEDNWWNVPVRWNSPLPRTYEYYCILADVESEIAENENLDVMLVPSA